MSDELPEPWGSALSGKGVHSYGDMAAGTGLSKATCHRLVNGVREASVATLRAVADRYFDGDVARVQELRKSRRRDFGPWPVPEGIAYLSPKQRAALEAVIAAMIPNEEESDGSADSAAPNQTPDPGPAQQPGTVTPIRTAGRDRAARTKRTKKPDPPES